jgi:aspartyl protease family protein
VIVAEIENPAMHRVLYLCVIFAIAGVVAVRKLDQSAKSSSGNGVNAMAMAAKPAADPAPSSNYRVVTLNSGPGGHFQSSARVDGRWLHFLVDTGASSVALRESAAAQLGIHPTARDYNVKISTANGTTRGARVLLDRVELEGITVRNVTAIVLPDESLGTNLLGMSFLSRVKFSHDRGRLVIEQ